MRSRKATLHDLPTSLAKYVYGIDLRRMQGEHYEITWWVCVILRQEEEGSEEAVKDNIDILS